MNVVWWLIKSSKTEIKVVLATLAILIILPIMTVVVAASSGIEIVSQTLANLNPITHLVELFDPNGKKVAALPLSTTWPVRGYISDEFGAWEDWRRALGLGPHTGIDIANERGVSGNPITPFMDGRVIAIDPEGKGDCGIYVKVQHEYDITSLYCHMLATTVVIGQDIKPGDIIGLEGMSGEATGPHVHFQIMLHGIPVNPRLFMVGEPERNPPSGNLR